MQVGVADPGGLEVDQTLKLKQELNFGHQTISVWRKKQFTILSSF